MAKFEPDPKIPSEGRGAATSAEDAELVHSYADYKSRIQSIMRDSAEAKNRYVEWSFTTMGVLLAGAVAAAAVATRLGEYLSMAAGLVVVFLTVPLLGPAVSYHSSARRYGLIQAHFSAIESSDIIKREPRPDETHLKAIIRSVDFSNANVQTRKSLCWNVLQMGPGYLFVGAILVIAISLLSISNWTVPLSWPVTAWEIEFPLASAFVALLFLTQLYWMRMDFLRGDISDVVIAGSGSEGGVKCWVCKEQDKDGKLTRAFNRFAQSKNKGWLRTLFFG